MFYLYNDFAAVICLCYEIFPNCETFLIWPVCRGKQK